MKTSSPRNKLKPVQKLSELPKSLRNTPIRELFQYHNDAMPFKKYTKAQLLVCMCMDNRKQLRLPDNFAYILRTGGGNVRYSEFKIAFAVAIGGVRHIALIAHNKCGMVNLASKRAAFIRGLVKNAGWSKKRAEDYFYSFSPMFEIVNEIDFVIDEARRLAAQYPKAKIVPLFYLLEDGKLYLLKDYKYE
ncbi:MAG TPA: carbonic anhydrase [Elusimicrobiales bacterium]|nr:carbonic anhydrase [Elusimicrobiales bacterium]